MSVDFDPYIFENKIRGMVMDLMKPSTRRMTEVQETLEELIRHDSHHKKRLDQMEFNFSVVQGKISLIDEVYKVSQDLKSGNITFEAEVNQKVQLMSGNVDKAIHKVEDLSIKILTMDENFRSSRTEITEYTNTINLIKSAIIDEHKKLVRFVEKSVSDIKKLWATAGDRLDKAEYAVLAFTDSALPNMLADVEKNNRLIKELQKEMKESMKRKIDAQEIAKLQKTMQFEYEKIYDRIDDSNVKIRDTNEMHQKIEEYLDAYLPMERWNDISEAICRLEPKNLKKFIELDEIKMEALRSRLDKEDIKFNNIQIIREKALESYSNSIARREVMKIEIEKADLEERAGYNRAKNSSSRRRRNRDSSREERHRNKESARDEKRRRHKEHDRFNQEFLDVPKDDSNINSENQLVLPQPSQTALVEPEPVIPEPTSLPEPPQFCVEVKEEPENLGESIAEIPKDDFPEEPLVLNSEVDPPVKEESLSYLQESEESYKNSLYNGFAQEPFIPVDLSKIEEEIAATKLALSDLTTELVSVKDQTEKNLRSIDLVSQMLSENLQQFQQTVDSNVSLMHEEIKQLILRNKQDKTDLAKQLSVYRNEQRVNTSAVERLDGQLANFNELLMSLAEFGKIAHSLMTQEEEDRQSLQLIGYSENKGQRAYISLKADCMSCSGQNPMVLGAFKMACLNYTPTPVKYKHRVYTRKQLIGILGGIANSAWAQACSKAPRYNTELGSYQSIPSLSDDSSQPQKHKYNRSQIIELPSLNTSKYFLEVNETPVGSARDIKKAN